LDPYPGYIGGHVGGNIDLKWPFDAGQQFSLTLTCIHSYESGSGEDRTRRERPLWQDHLVAQTEPSARGTRLAFRFDVPDGYAESGVEKNSSYTIWRLSLRGDLPGTDLDRDYELPVFATATQSRSLPDVAVRKSRDMQRSADDSTVRQRANLKSTATGKRLFYPLGRHVGSAISGCVVGGAFIAVGWFLIVEAGHTVFGGVFGGIGGLIAAACLYMTLNSLEVVASDGAIVTVRRVLGIPVSQKRMLRSAFSHFKKVSSLRTQTGNQHTIYYSIHALDHDGRPLIVGEGFRGETEANAATRLLQSEFGLVDAANDSAANPGLPGAADQVSAKRIA
jgi:hypothetical protein